MNVIIDHLSAIIVGAVIVGALMVLNLRDSEHAVQEAVDYAASQRAASVLNVVGRDLDNLLSPEQSTAFLGDYGAAFEQTTLEDDGVEAMTRRLTIPSLTPPAAGAAPVPVQITYRIEPTGRTQRVGDVERPLFRLFRGTDFGDGYLERAISEEVLGFRVEHCTPAGCQPEGAPQEATTHLELELAVAADSPNSDLHVARQGNTYRPQNLPANRTGRTTVEGEGEIALDNPELLPLDLPAQPGRGDSR